MASGLSRLRTTFAALESKNYAIYTVGYAAGLLGFWMQRMATGWLAWELTNSGTWLGLIAFADLFPTVAVGLIAGVGADRWDRLLLTRVTQAATVLIVLLLATAIVLGYVGIWLLLVFAVLSGTVAAVNQPARLCLIPALVPASQIPAAIAINSVVFHVARIAGPAIAGIVIWLGDVAIAYALSGLFATAFLVALGRLRPANCEPTSGMTPDLFGGVAGGLRYIANNPPLFALLVLMAASTIGVKAVVELLPGLADVVFGVEAMGLAVLIASTGLGAVFAGLWLAGRQHCDNIAELAVKNIICMAALGASFSFFDELWAAIPVLIAFGFCMASADIAVQTIIQTGVQPFMRGRVLSIHAVIARGGPAIGAVTMGTASDFVGFQLPVLFGASAVMALWFWIRRRAVVPVPNTQKESPGY
jgi:MFS family permease